MMRGPAAGSDLSNFNWDALFALLSLLLFFDNFLLVLRQSSDAIVSFLQANRALFTSLATGGDGRRVGDTSVTLDSLLLMMRTSDTQWRSTLLTVPTCLSPH